MTHSAVLWGCIEFQLCLVISRTEHLMLNVIDFRCRIDRIRNGSTDVWRIWLNKEKWLFVQFYLMKLVKVSACLTSRFRVKLTSRRCRRIEKQSKWNTYWTAYSSHAGRVTFREMDQTINHAEGTVEWTLARNWREPYLKIGGCCNGAGRKKKVT